MAKMTSRLPSIGDPSLARLGSSSSVRQPVASISGSMAFGGDREHEEDSLSEGLEDQMVNFVDMKKAVDDMTNVYTTLQKQCSALRARQQTLENDYTARSSDLEALNAQIQELTTTRDGLQAQAKAQDAQSGVSHPWWGMTTPSSSTTPPPIPEGDIAGRLNRKIWVLEEQVKSLKDEHALTERTHQEELEGERAISAGLRDRISGLEGKRRGLRLEKESFEKKVKDLQGLLDSSNQARMDAENQYERERKDSSDALHLTTGQLEVICSELEGVKRDKERIEAELRQLRQEVQSAQTIKSPPRVLQSREVNIPLSQSSPPITPTKPKVRGYPTLLPSPSTRTSPSNTHDLQLRLLRLEAQYAHLLETHQCLKATYDKLRDVHEKDIEHMKEYRKAQLAKEDEHKKKRAEKKARALREGRSVSGSAAPPCSTSVPTATNQAGAGAEELTSSGDTVMVDRGRIADDILVEESESLPKIAGRSTPQTAGTSTKRSERSESTQDKGDEGNRSEKVFQPTSLVQAPTPRRRQSDSGQPPPHSPYSVRAETSSTPGTRQSERKRAVVQPVHVTPWLGGSDRLASTNSKRRLAASRSRDLDLARDEEIFASPPDLLMSTPTVNRTPLVRDRGGGGEVASLRKMVMQKTVAHEVETPIRFASTPISRREQREQRDLNATPGPSTHTPSNSGSRTHNTTASSSSKKRRVTDIDMEGLTPDEKAVKRKMLAKMPASERRELYKDYKGKGRYVRPEEVHTSVREEYEIDPEQNEGAAFAFHDVKRKRAERKQMHGGDCECCKDYYEAVGELPRFNHGPVWRDEPVSADAESKVEDAVREHQNIVSRHRETWTKPPTPPGYWKIGFPSTQDVQEQNEKADQMMAEKEAKLRRETMARNSKWRKKT
ncbi:hypothetical protein IAT40_007771 [Kwoniella sp. CBS 6097]